MPWTLAYFGKGPLVIEGFLWNDGRVCGQRSRQSEASEGIESVLLTVMLAPEILIFNRSLILSGIAVL